MTATALKHGESKIKHFFFLWAEKVLPRRIKRVIYVSSILALIEQINNPDDALLAKLNEILDLGKYPASAGLPMFCAKSLIWVNCETYTVELHGKTIPITELAKEPRQEEDNMIVGRYFSNIVPKWLKYGSDDLMTRDISLLLANLGRLQAA